MATRKEKEPGVRLDSNLSAQRTRERQAGIASLFGEAGDEAPAMLSLQKGLLAGIGAALSREAKRLEARGDRKTPRNGAMARRAERVARLKHNLGEAETLVRRVVESVAEPGMFHGYVWLGSGAPAVGYAVRITPPGASVKPMSAKTDDTGYFRMAVAAPATKSPGAKRERGAKTAAAKSAAQNATNAAAGTGAHCNAQVDILDPAGRLIFRDPAPPGFDGGNAPAFRIYPLLGKEFAIDPEADE